MTNSVNLYLASGVSDGIGFWVVNFTEDDDIININDSKLLECYRKELLGLEAAIEVKQAINTTLDILSLESKFERYKIDSFFLVYSSEIPIEIIEAIFDLWVQNYNNENSWKKYIGFLNLRKKINKNNDYIRIGLKGNTYEFSKKLDKILSFRPANSSLRVPRSNELMW